MAARGERRSRASAGRPRQALSIVLARRRLTALVPELGEEGAKIVGGREVLVDRCETDEGNIVELLEPLHDEFADPLGADLEFAQTLELAHDAGDHALGALRIDLALAQCRIDRAR